MLALKAAWKKAMNQALARLAVELNFDLRSVDSFKWVIQTPPKPEMGDLALPVFGLAKILGQSPAGLAKRIVDVIEARPADQGPFGQARAFGPYVNIFFDQADLAEATLKAIEAAGSDYGRNQSLAGQKIMLEFSCPNTNKPLHLGHLRNNILGFSLAALFEASGAEVRRVNLINDRGVHICKSMLAYQRLGEGRTPAGENRKPDHFVGDYYIAYNRLAKTDPVIEEQARCLLLAWERGDKQVRELWRRMNDWAISGLEQTYKKTGISFDQVYLESETYEAGRQTVKEALAQGIFYQEADGSIWVDLTEIDLDKKVLLRADGTSLYLTQDLGTALARYRDWPFDRLIYVVASEQRYHFQVLFHVLKKLDFPPAEQLFHLAYGMVNLPEGKMKSREGTVVDADDLLAGLSDLAAREIVAKERQNEVGDLKKTADAVALAALHYYLLQVSPVKDMVFNPAASINFNGNTGPYLQYTGARICSVLRKYERQKPSAEPRFKPSLLSSRREKSLLLGMAGFPELIAKAAAEMNPSLPAAALYDLCRDFSRFYQEQPILGNPDPDLVYSRICLLRGLKQVLRQGLKCLNIPFLEKM